MNEPGDALLTDILTDLLTDDVRDALGVPGKGRLLDSSPRSRVWEIERADGSTAVLKHLVEGPEGDARYAREAAGLRLAGRVRPPVSPRLLGTDAGARVLVLERVGHRPPGEGWEVAYATALARLHAAAPASTEREAAADLDALPRWAGPDHTDIDSFLTLADSLGVNVPRHVPRELKQLIDRLGRPPERPALLHGDPCPGNDLHTADGIRFIDFEQASLGNGLNELAYLRVGFPTCWCVTAAPRSLLRAAEAAYRTAWREATGSDPTGKIADACAGWLIRGDALVPRAERGSADQLARLTREDWTWGTATARQRLLHRLDVVGRIIAEGEGPGGPVGASGASGLGGLGGLCTEMAGQVLARWPELRPVPVRRPEP